MRSRTSLLEICVPVPAQMLCVMQGCGQNRRTEGLEHGVSTTGTIFRESSSDFGDGKVPLEVWGAEPAEAASATERGPPLETGCDEEDEEDEDEDEDDEAEVEDEDEDADAANNRFGARCPLRRRPRFTLGPSSSS